MLKKQHRLTSRECSLVFKEGKKIFSQNFMLVVLKSGEEAKISTTVSKKIYKNATQRNKSRRYMYDIVRENCSLWSKSKNIFILVATKPVLEIPQGQANYEVGELFRKIG